MDYQVSARKYRPGTFADVIGQPHVVQTLVNAITTKRIAHAFLFSGTRGVGKTTVARILAKALNCERGPTGTPCDTCPNCVEITQGTSVDVIEIDGASNTGVDDVREIRENVKYSPFRGSYRVYIIDEVHMLSNSAFNALLKTLEEPPAHVVFIFATTEIHKIPATILSRCQHYNFRRIPRTEIIQRLRHVAMQDGLMVEDRSLAAIARASEGSMRDALSLLDQAVAFGGKTLSHSDLEALLGSVPQEHIRALIGAIVAQDSPAALRVVAQLLDQGYDLRAYCAELVEHVRNLMVAAVVPPAPGPPGQPDLKRLQSLIDLSEDEIRQVVADAKAFTVEQLQELFRICTQAEDAVRVSAHPRFVLEVAAVRGTRLLGAGTQRPPATANTPAPSNAAMPTSTPTRPRESPAPPAKAEAEKQSTAQMASATPQTATPAPPVAPVPDRASRGVIQQSTRPSPQSPVPAPPPAQRAVAPSASPAQPAAPTQEGTASSRVTDGGGPTTPPVTLNWEEVVERMATEHPNIGAFLEMGSLVGIEGTSVTIGYPASASFALGRMQKDENLRLVTEICAELAGRPVRVRVVELAEGEKAGPSMAEIRAARERDQKRALLEQARSHPVVKQALDAFGGELVEVRQASPRKEIRS
jgi:DNA polymerase-3 subunit gamma/tau